MNFRLFDGPDMSKLIDIARKSPPGLPRDQLAPGCYVMISPNKGTGDRSYTRDIWSIVALSGPHMAMKSLKPRGCLGDQVIVNTLEHEIYDAHEMARAMSAERPKAGGDP